MRALSRAFKAGVLTGAVAAGLAVSVPAAGAATTATSATTATTATTATSGTPNVVSQAVNSVTGTVSGVGSSGGAIAQNLLNGNGGSVLPQLSGAPSGVHAPYAELADAGTGSVMWTRSQYTKVPMGSITKVMTAYVVIEAGNLNREITVPSGITAYDNKYGGSTAGLKPGERLTARQLLYAMLIPSGCDAAYALANAYGPGLSGFIAKMNAAAARLGMGRTHFTDFSGLPDPTETSTYSDADNLVKLGRAAMSLPLFASIVGQSSYYLPAQAGYHPAFHWTNTNPLYGHYSGTDGIKTGNTNAAGYCLLFEAKRNGRALIGVVLDEPGFSTASSDAQKMMNWGWNHL